MSFRIVPFRSSLGAEIVGLDLHSSIGADEAAALRQAWHDYKVLLFRSDVLSYQEQIAFSKIFGKLEAPVMKLLKYSKGSGQRSEVPPEITIVSNIKENDRPIGQLGHGEAFWHTDSNFIEEPPSASLLHGIEIPPSGGNTSFMDMEIVLDTLPEHLLKQIKGKSCKHDPSLSSTGVRRADYDEVTDVSKSLGPDHPLIRTHPVTKRKSLYLGRRPNAYIVGISIDKSEALLNELWEFVTHQTGTYEHVWQVGDLLLWDNRCVMHRRDGFDDRYRRLMHKTVLKGNKPF